MVVVWRGVWFGVDVSSFYGDRVWRYGLCCAVETRKRGV